MAVRLELPDDHPNVALVTIDRPERANALDPPTLRALAAAWERIAADSEIRCAVLTGAGDRVFCAGMIWPPPSPPHSAWPAVSASTPTSSRVFAPSRRPC